MHARVAFSFGLRRCNGHKTSAQDEHAPNPAMPRSLDLDSTPELGAKILIFKQKPLQDILLGRKTLEVRSKCFNSGVYWFGCKGVLHAVAKLGPGMRVESEKDWGRLRQHHLMNSASPPYPRTFVFQILHCERRKLTFHHTKGAVNIVRYRGA